MLCQNDYIIENIRTQQIAEYLRQAEQDRLLAQLKVQRPNRLWQLARGTWRAIGYLLLAIGRRVDRVETPQTHVRIGHAATGK